MLNYFSITLDKVVRFTLYQYKGKRSFCTWPKILITGEIGWDVDAADVSYTVRRKRRRR